MSNVERQYTSEEVGEIIRLALQSRPEPALDHKDLLDIGSEFGLDESAIDGALEQQSREQQRAARARHSRQGFTYHLYSYLGVSLFLLVVNAMTPGPWWFQWPLLGWGVGVAAHYAAVFKPTRN